MDKVILYISPIPCPSPSAAFSRILHNCKSIQKAGCKVILLGSPSNGKINSSQPITYRGINIYSVETNSTSTKSKIGKIQQYIQQGHHSIQWMKDQKDLHIQGIILYSGYSPFLIKLLPYCRKNSIPLAFDTVEWYQASNPWIHWLNPYYWNIEWAMQKLIPRCNNVIAISDYISQYYGKKVDNTIQIPPLIDTKNITPNLNSNIDRLVLSYTGNPGHKDLFNNYLEAIFTIIENHPSYERSLVLHIAGIPKKRLMQFQAIQKRNLLEIPDFIISEGRVSQERALAITRNADFSLLQRPVNKVSLAGFPTKLVESMAVGTPVILNHTSNLAQYIHHMDQGIVCKDESLESLIESILLALQSTQVEKNKMREAARKTAETHFDFRNHSESFQKFIHNLQLQKQQS